MLEHLPLISPGMPEGWNVTMRRRNLLSYFAKISLRLASLSGVRHSMPIMTERRDLASFCRMRESKVVCSTLIGSLYKVIATM